ncbi:hydrogenase expression/formation protein HypE [Calderihabitans maritimus]|uniref:Hydrogenase expression/formation protein HypE n=1 Tax=Calderihabitans maritimus TaxID=1246530 RepID=A0A1Z5HP69_9FIRM|nr:hydrogenase expression/formation protein HypE [Calderihabitans maritimus]GAW91121.1 hydrogenase expression/formation protein HypE [Calderihabitans maritimus]
MEDKILLAHGSGGKLYRRLVNEVFLPAFQNPVLAKLEDQANLTVPKGNIAFTTDSYVVNPLFFPGGDIGKLAVCGTVNDLAVGGAKPLYLSVGFIIEEGFSLSSLRDIVNSMKKAAEEAGVEIVTGDTKVVEKGLADGLYINTAGIGVTREGINLSSTNAQPGDLILLSGTIGDHGIAVMAAREGLTVMSPVLSDVAPLNGMISDLIDAAPGVRVMRDPTRGGVATTLNELAAASRVSMKIYETEIPVREEVASVCEIFGFDPLYVANEGKILAVVPKDQADDALRALRQHRYGRNAAIIGEVTAGNPGKVYLETAIGGSRVIDMMAGEQLPRIC